MNVKGFKISYYQAKLLSHMVEWECHAEVKRLRAGRRGVSSFRFLYYGDYRARGGHANYPPGQARLVEEREFPTHRAGRSVDALIKKGLLTKKPIKSDWGWVTHYLAQVPDWVAEVVRDPDKLAAHTRAKPVAEAPLHTHADLIRALAAHFAPPEWVFVDEAPIGTGGANQRIDGFALNCWKSKGYRRLAFEVKARRSDWTREMKNPWKRQPAMQWATHFYFVTPVGLVTVKELPKDTGLITFDENLNMRYARRAPRGNGKPASWQQTAALLRRVLMISGEERDAKQTGSSI